MRQRDGEDLIGPTGGIVAPLAVAQTTGDIVAKSSAVKVRKLRDGKVLVTAVARRLELSPG